jgi:uncharacterized damage-inducible protein DinB
MRFKSLITALTDALEQERILLGSVEGSVYTATGVGTFRSSIGAHIRHNLDHFTSFFDGLKSGQVDYEARRRDDRIARSTEHALADIERHLEALEVLSDAPEQIIAVREENDFGDETLSWLSSSVGRELQFLLGHTVHHHAIIALLLSQHGVALPEGFGVAPSTQRYERRHSGDRG